MLAWGLAQLTGSLLLLWQPVLPHPGIFVLSLPIALAAFADRRSRWLAAFWLGAALAAWQADRNLDDRLDPSLDGEVVELRGEIVGLVERDERRQRFRFRIESGEFNGEPVELPREVRLSLYRNSWDDANPALPIASGERWQWRVKLRRARGFANPGGFDYERWLFAEGIGATGYVRDPGAAKRLSGGESGWRARIAARVEALASGPAAGVVRGLATGDQAGISDPQWEVLRKTGTAHLVSISGLHIALVTALGLGLATFIRRRLFPRSALFWPPFAGASMALVYSALAGFELPVVRALAAAIILLSALAWRRQLAPSHAFGVVLAAVLVIDPLAPLDAGFWLSFVAVAAILFLLAGRRPAGSRPRRALHVQMGLFALLAPLILLTFGRLPMVSPLANLVAIPIFDLLAVPCILLALLLLPWPALAGQLLAVPGWLLTHLLEFLAMLAKLDPGVSTATLPPVVLVLAAAALLLLCAPRAWPGRILALGLLAPAVAANLFPPSRPLTVHFLDVGQGLAVVVETAAHTLVYDTGPSFGTTDAASMVVVPFLEARGREPDRLMISHDHNDHAGGLASLAERYPEAQRLGRVEDATVIDCAEHAWQWDGVSFRVLHPPPRVGAEGNDDSCVLRIESGDFSMLLTGDIEAAAESRVVANDNIAADVVLVPHHGSRTSSTRAFVNATGAEFAVVAAGHGNRWDFPKPDVVQRWEAAGAVVLSTGEQGNISVIVEDGKMRVESFRDRRQLWRDAAARPGSLSLPVR
ncbi:MAG TPA: DNA internalization-related competence protein ComEC/Rec2 [Gammaproteobacteria bacterium]